MKGGPERGRMRADRRPPWYPRAEFPRELDLCLTNQCNLDCAYCYFAAKARSKPDWLDLPRIDRALDHYLDRVPVRRIQKVSISGGEPFLDFRLTADAAGLVRRRIGARPNLEVFTNGTLLTRARVEELDRHDVTLIVSMDGDRAVQDANRRYWDAPDRSVFETVAAHLRALPPRLRRRIHAGATFNARTAGRLGESVEFLLGLGLGCVIVDFDVLAVWKPEEIDSLERGVRRLKRLYAGTITEGFGEGLARVRFDFLMPRVELAEVTNPPGLREVSLAPDGLFYPSGLVSGHGRGKAKYLIGDLRSGLDPERMNAVLAELRAYFGPRRFKGYNACPTHVYFDCRLRGRDPDRVFAAGESLFERLDPVVSPVVDFELLANALGSRKDFGAFDHPPRHRAPAEVPCLEVCLPGGGSLGPARDAVDLLLYSPGRRKELALRPGGARPDRASLEALAAYAMMKSSVLEKRLSILVLAPERLLTEWGGGFVREHGLEVAADSSSLKTATGLDLLLGLAGPGRATVWIVPGPAAPVGPEHPSDALPGDGRKRSGPAGSGRLLPEYERLRRAGLPRFGVSPSRGPWPAAALARLEGELSEVARVWRADVLRGEAPVWANLDRLLKSGTAPVGPEHPSDALPGDGRKRSGPAAPVGKTLLTWRNGRFLCRAAAEFPQPAGPDAASAGDSERGLRRWEPRPSVPSACRAVERAAVETMGWLARRAPRDPACRRSLRRHADVRARAAGLFSHD